MIVVSNPPASEWMDVVGKMKRSNPPILETRSQAAGDAVICWFGFECGIDLRNLLLNDSCKTDGRPYRSALHRWCAKNMSK